MSISIAACSSSPAYDDSYDDSYEEDDYGLMSGDTAATINLGNIFKDNGERLKRKLNGEETEDEANTECAAITHYLAYVYSKEGRNEDADRQHDKFLFFSAKLEHRPNRASEINDLIDEYDDTYNKGWFTFLNATKEKCDDKYYRDTNPSKD